MTNKPTQEQIKKAKDALITLGMEAVAYCEDTALTLIMHIKQKKT